MSLPPSNHTSAAKVEADSSLVQSAEFVDGKPVKLRIPDKIAAAQLLVKMCGRANPERVELSAKDTLGQVHSEYPSLRQDQSSGRQRRSQLTQDWTREWEEVLPKPALSLLP